MSPCLRPLTAGIDFSRPPVTPSVGVDGGWMDGWISQIRQSYESVIGHNGDRTCIFLPDGACERTSHHLRPHHDDLREILGLKRADKRASQWGK